MKIRLTPLILGLLLMASATLACRQGGMGSVDRSKDEAELRALDLARSDAANRKDLDAIVSFMADDGETLAPNEPAARGKAAVQASWAKLIGRPALSVYWEPLRVQIAESGELGFTSGSYMLTFNDAQGQIVSDRGKYLEVWKKVDGKWKCLSDAYNSDNPLP